MLTKTLSEAKKKQRISLIKAMNNDIGSIDSVKDSWNPAQISERAKDISYIRSLVDSWNPAQLNEALKMLDLPVIDTWNPAQIEEQRRNIVFYLAERTLTGNPITLKILGNLNPEVTGLKVIMNPIQDLHGYEYPWVGGAGKNKLPFDISAIKALNTAGTWSGDNYTHNGVTYSLKSDGIISTSNTASGTSVLRLPFTYSETEMILNGCPSGGGVTVGYSVIAANSAGSTLGTDVGSGVTISASNVANITQIQIIVRNGTSADNLQFKPMIRLSTVTDATFEPYSNICPISGRTEASVTRTAGEDVETKTHQYSETIYGGEDDFVNGGLSNEWGYIASYDGETLPGEWISDRDVYAPDTTPTTGAEVAYKLATPTTIQTSAEEITLLKGTNVLSTDGDSIELKYKQNF